MQSCFMQSCFMQSCFMSRHKLQLCFCRCEVISSCSSCRFGILRDLNFDRLIVREVFDELTLYISIYNL